MKPFDYAIKIGGRDYVLRYTFRIRRKWENEHKQTVTGLLNRVANPATQSADDIVALLSLMLSDSVPGITDEQCMDLIDEAGGEDVILGYMMDAISDQAAGEGGAVNP